MATTSPITVDLRVDTRLAVAVGYALYPLVWIRLISVERAVKLACRFVRVKVATPPVG